MTDQPWLHRELTARGKGKELRMAKPRTIYFAIRRRTLEAHSVEAVLDMLRYDGALVEGNAPRGFYMFSITRTDGGAPIVHRDRWRSFGIEIDAEALTPRELSELCDGVEILTERQARG